MPVRKRTKNKTAITKRPPSIPGNSRHNQNGTENFTNVLQLYENVKLSIMFIAGYYHAYIRLKNRSIDKLGTRKETTALYEDKSQSDVEP